MTVAYRQPSKGRITYLVIYSTGLKVFGEYEWRVRKHGAEKGRVWRTLHLAVDPVTHDIVAAEVSLENAHDAEVLWVHMRLVSHDLLADSGSNAVLLSMNDG